MTIMKNRHTKSANPTKAVTVRVPDKRLRAMMRARKTRSQSELINLLLAEEEERVASHRALRDTFGTVPASDLDDRDL